MAMTGLGWVAFAIICIMQHYTNKRVDELLDMYQELSEKNTELFAEYLDIKVKMLNSEVDKLAVKLNLDGKEIGRFAIR